MERNASETIVITGASSGIGRELAIQLAAPGRELWLIGRDRARLDEVAARVAAAGATARTEAIDLADAAACAAFLGITFPPEKPVDLVYLSAAVTLFGEVQDTLFEDWDRIYQINLLSPVQWTHYFYSNMVPRKKGRIVIVSSVAAYTGYPTATAYATMKGGLLGLFRSLWHEAKDHGISLHLASPGYVRTGIYKSATFRNTTYENTMKQIENLGFGMLEADQAARGIIRSVDAGDSEFALPGYASIMKWIAPRFPGLIDMTHTRILKFFRTAS